MLLCLASCADDPVSRHRAAITQGTPTDAWPAVVAILDDGVPRCSGTLVDERRVLTAAHCFAEELEIFVGSNPAAGGARVGIAGWILHPEFDELTLDNDLAIIELDAPVEVTPMPPHVISDEDALLGAHVEVVGFGLPEFDDQSLAQPKREGFALVTEVEPEVIRLAPDPSQPCRGDSGGPVFAGGRLIGVVSSGDARCESRARAIRLDDQAAFLGDMLVDDGLGGCAVSTKRSDGRAVLVVAISLLMARALTRRRRG